MYTIVHVGDSLLIETMTEEKLIEFLNDPEVEKPKILRPKEGKLLDLEEAPHGVMIFKGTALEYPLKN